MYLEIQKLCLPWCPSLRAASHRGGLFVVMRTRRPLPDATLLRRHFSYDPETGTVTCLRRWCDKIKEGKEVGSPDQNGYLFVSFRKIRYQLHRIIYRIVTGVDLGDLEVDHINANKADNRWENLRRARPSQNQHNQKTPRNNVSGVKGVSRYSRTNQWQTHVSVTVNGKQFKKYLGLFSDVAVAGEVVRVAREKLHAEFTNHGTGFILLEAS